MEVKSEKSVSELSHCVVYFGLRFATSSRCCLARSLQTMAATPMATLVAVQRMKGPLFADRT